MSPGLERDFKRLGRIEHFFESKYARAAVGRIDDLDVRVVSGVVGNSTGLGQQAGYGRVMRERYCARMLDFAKHRNEALRNTRYVNNIVAA